MKNSLNFYFSFILLFFFFSCQNGIKKQWIETENHYLFWGTLDSSLEYVWKGKVVDKVINGKGSLSIYKDGSLLSSKIIDAHFGAIDNTDIKKINSDKYIGNIDDHFMTGFAVLEKSSDVYIGNFENSKPNGLLNLYKSNKIYYKGNWKDGLFEGQGTLYKSKDNVKIGIWKKGTLKQIRTTVQNNLGIYSGDILNGYSDGNGLMAYKTGEKYNGYWKLGKWSGYGLYISGKDSIEGEWREGKLNGSGIAKTSRFYYDGNWVNSVPQGLGSVLYADSTIYSGNWVNGQREGYGEIVYEDSDSYQGNWKRNKKNGKGRYLYKNGDIYNGNWLDDLQNGDGKYSSSTFQYHGEWKSGYINGKGKLSLKNGDFYNGSFYKNKKSGSGYYKFNNGNSYDGEFINGKFEGIGIFKFSDGNRYEGDFHDGKIKGNGTLYYYGKKDTIAISANWDGSTNFPNEASVLFSNGDLYEGKLINGLPTNQGKWTTEKERSSKSTSIKDKSSITICNNFYKKHKEGWNTFVIWTSLALTAVEVAAPFVGLAPIALIACIANYALNGIDIAISTASHSINIKEDIENGKDCSEELKALGEEVAINVALIAAPKVLKRIPFKKGFKGVKSTVKKNSIARKIFKSEEKESKAIIKNNYAPNPLKGSSNKEICKISDKDIPSTKTKKGKVGINKERYSYRELRHHPMINEILKNPLLNKKMKTWAKNCNNRNVFGFKMYKVNGEYDFWNLRVGPAFKLPHIENYDAILNKMPKYIDALKKNELTPIKKKEFIRSINYDLYRKWLAKECNMTYKEASYMIGKFSCILHEDKNGYIYMVPEWAHSWFKHKGYVHSIMNTKKN